MDWRSALVFMFTSIACIELSFLQWQTLAKTVIVGGSAGWTNFDDSLLAAPDYASWASSQSVQTGDSLVFKYKPIYHDVYILPNKKAFDYCNFTDATVLDEGKSGSFTWIPSRQGVYYFACNRSVEGGITHCEAGQKFSISVSAISDLQSPVISPSLAPVMSPAGVPSSYAPIPSPIFTPSSTPSIPSVFPPSPEPNPDMDSVPALSPSFSPAGHLPPAAIPSARPPMGAPVPNPILAPATIASPPIHSSLTPSVPVASSPVPSSSHSPFISSTPYAPFAQVGTNPGSAVPLPGLNEDKSAAVMVGLQRSRRIGLFCFTITSYAALLLLV